MVTGPRRGKEPQNKKTSPASSDDGRRHAGKDVPEMNLRGLRESLGKTQDEMARLAEVSQSQLSKIERRRDHLTSTLRRYVQALGGDLEIVAVVGKKRIPLRNV